MNAFIWLKQRNAQDIADIAKNERGIILEEVRMYERVETDRTLKRENKEENWCG